MTNVTEPGLRERKRVATKRAIELAAIRLVARNGLERLTIDEIVREADVSPRTFFNYFPSKEAALIGDSPILPDRERMDSFVMAGPGESIFRSLCELFIDAPLDPVADHELGQLRKSVLKQHPELLVLRMAAMRQFEAELAEFVALRVQRDEPDLSLDHEALTQRVRLITLVAFAAMRHGWSCWADGENATDLAARLRSSFAELESLFAPMAKF